MTNKYDISDFPRILLLDTNDPQSTSAALVTANTVICKTEQQRAQELLVLLEEIFKEASNNLSSVRAIGVVGRDGSLTGQRIGIAVANTLAWVINVPLFTVSGELFSLSQEIKNGKKFEITKTLHAN